MSFIAHAVYYSEQPIANAVSAVYESDYQLDIISNFKDIPGFGVELSVDGIKVCLAIKEYMQSRGVTVPEEDTQVGQTFYMAVAGRVMGKIVISSEINSELENLVPEMKANKFSRCVLLTEDNKESGQQFAEMMNFTEMYPQCDSEKKLRIIGEISRKAKNAVSFIYSNGIDAHSKADLDIRVSRVREPFRIFQ
jgi:Cd2+/Zn2+-exporting ATPase